jgi:3'-phosphoadenosine 5'-phosphosulfate (PAPS) 3'-phosphatase
MDILEGTADIFAFPHVGQWHWDMCAPEVLIKAIGGKVTTLEPNPREFEYNKNTPYTKEFPSCLFAGSEQIHAEVIRRIKH